MRLVRDGGKCNNTGPSGKAMDGLSSVHGNQTTSASTFGNALTDSSGLC
jgi:hypothetical protein